MSRSYQHHAYKTRFSEIFFAWAVYSSNKKDKVNANRKFRKKARHLLKRIIKNNEAFYKLELPKTVREVSDVYNFSSDGLAQHHFIDAEDKNWCKQKFSK